MLLLLLLCVPVQICIDLRCDHKGFSIRSYLYIFIMDICFLFVPRPLKKFTDFLFLVQSVVHDPSLFVMSLLLSPEMIWINAASSVVIQPREEKTRAIRSLTAQIVMFHCVIPTLSKNITLRKLSDYAILTDLKQINDFWKSKNLKFMLKINRSWKG